MDKHFTVTIELSGYEGVLIEDALLKQAQVCEELAAQFFGKDLGRRLKRKATILRRVAGNLCDASIKAGIL
ncbi:MAG: hypothetical protein OCU12_06255 [Methanophagales archaeon]|nr:hypothetical protein [Methanophagales archaeon]